jgi:hypothetical protein
VQLILAFDDVRRMVAYSKRDPLCFGNVTLMLNEHADGEDSRIAASDLFVADVDADDPGFAQQLVLDLLLRLPQFLGNFRHGALL